MSHVDNCLLSFSVLEDEKARAAEVNAFLAAWDDRQQFVTGLCTSCRVSIPPCSESPSDGEDPCLVRFARHEACSFTGGRLRRTCAVTIAARSTESRAPN
jgi:hypothetical protein